MDKKVKQLIDKIAAADRIVIITHHNPDGDAIGTSLAMAELIRAHFGKLPPCIHSGTLPSNLNWLPNRAEWFKSTDTIADDFIPDLAIMIDTSGGNTGAESMAIFNRARDSVKIDHHQISPDIANLNFHKIVNSTAQVLLEIAKDAGWKISPLAATYLYTAISTDTGRFAWADDSSAFTAAAECIDLGANAREIDEAINVSNRDNIVENAKIIINAEFLYDGKLAISLVPFADYQKLDGKGGHAMDWLREIDTVEYVAILKESEPGIVHASLRSRRLPVHTIAASLGGGGHVNAAAARLETDLDTAKEMILAAFKEVL